LALQKDFLEQRFNLKGSSYLLTEVKRQEDGSYILSNATEIRKAIDQNAQSHPIEGIQNKSIYTAADKYVKELNSEGYDKSVVIGVSHKANSFFNKLARERMFGHAMKVLEPGDLLMVNRNWTRGEAVLYNGDHVVLESVDWNLQEQVAGLHFVAVRIRPLNGDENDSIEDYAILETLVEPGGNIDQRKEQELRKQRYAKNPILQETNRPSDDRYLGALNLIYGHAITCNKAQGGEWRKVYINTFGIPNLKWQYTAVTRGIDDVEKM
jgi:exodeoxyribonuclease-5